MRSFDSRTEACVAASRARATRTCHVPGGSSSPTGPCLSSVSNSICARTTGLQVSQLAMCSHNPYETDRQLLSQAVYEPALASPP